MIPQRFVFEYPRRCLQLIDSIEGEARRKNLVGSFSLMIAPSLFLIPYERLDKKHPLREGQKEPGVYEALKRVSRQKFLEAEFWSSRPSASWRFGRIVSPVNDTFGWRTSGGVHPFAVEESDITGAAVDKVVRVVRNSLAHGNIVYLDEHGTETQGAMLHYLAFLSRYEETEEQRKISETYRMVATTEEGFLSFLKEWANWLQQQGMDQELYEAA